MAFAHYFDHKFWKTKQIWVKFILLENRHPELQFEHIFYVILIKTKWVMTIQI